MSGWLDGWWMGRKIDDRCDGDKDDGDRSGRNNRDERNG